MFINDGQISKKCIDSDDEQNVEHLSSQALLETPDNEVHYAIRSADGLITYRVLQVEEGSEVQQLVPTSPTNYQVNNSQPMLASNINGQVYIVNSNEVFAGQTGTRAIAPKTSIIEGPHTKIVNISNIKKRDERRRATHNEVERRRRDKINNWITKLSKIIPENHPTDIKGNGHYDGQSKGGILAKACEYILELKEAEQKLDTCMKENKVYLQSIDVLKQKNLSLERENRALKEMLKRSGIEVPSEIMS